MAADLWTVCGVGLADRDRLTVREVFRAVALVNAARAEAARAARQGALGG